MIRKKIVWIVNPFDVLPGESSVKQRYWTLSEYFINKGYDVVWWSSDFNHINKSKRLIDSIKSSDSLKIKLIETLKYKSNISFTRLISHYLFSLKFYSSALEYAVDTGDFPSHIIVSSPPFGLTDKALKLKSVFDVKYNVSCSVTTDIMDAWPEVFYQVLPHFLFPYRKILFSPFHYYSKKAILSSDKVTTVGETYSHIVNQYLDIECGNHSKVFRCYHGCDVQTDIMDLQTKHTNTSSFNCCKKLSIVYLGNMGEAYDLETLLSVAKIWKDNDRFPYKIYLAGGGIKLNYINEFCKNNNLFDLVVCNSCGGKSQRVSYLGFIDRIEMDELLSKSDVALVPNMSKSFVACPYKVSEYSSYGLPIISCLDGELSSLLSNWDCGVNYNAENTDSLMKALDKYHENSDLLLKHSLNSLEMAKNIFDKKVIYPSLISHIIK